MRARGRTRCLGIGYLPTYYQVHYYGKTLSCLSFLGDILLYHILTSIETIRCVLRELRSFGFYSVEDKSDIYLRRRYPVLVTTVYYSEKRLG